MLFFSQSLFGLGSIHPYFIRSTTTHSFYRDCERQLVQEGCTYLLSVSVFPFIIIIFFTIYCSLHLSHCGFFFMSVSAPQCSLLTLWCVLLCSFNITGFVFFEALSHRKLSQMDGWWLSFCLSAGNVCGVKSSTLWLCLAANDLSVAI